MSGLAHVLMRRGVRVSGSDLAPAPAIERLVAQGARVAIGHDAAHVRGADLVVYSSAIAPQNPELVAARNAGIPVSPRGRMLGACMTGKVGIAVSGSHGKTTTTAMIAVTLVAAGQDPTILVGADVPQCDGNARIGAGPHIVVEADESDGSFVYLTPAVAVVTNIEEEHLDYYRNVREIVHAYHQFVGRLPADGVFIGCGDDPGVRQLLFGIRSRRLTYGLRRGCDVTAERLQVAGRDARYVARFRGRRLGSVMLQVPGAHNVVNSLAAIGVGLTLGLEFSAVRRGLGSFAGASRRFQSRGEVNGIMVVEDYAHHPTEIEATLHAARTWPGRRVFCVFQPHRFSRTKYLRERFGACFSSADRVILTDVYAASEDPLDGVGADALSRVIRAHGCSSIQVVPRPQIVPHLLRQVQSGDLVLVLGAGDIGQVAVELVQALKAPAC